MSVKREQKIRKIIMAQLVELYLQRHNINPADKHISIYDYFGFNFNISNNNAYNWLIRGFPVSRKQEIIRVFAEYELVVSQEEWEVLFRKKKKVYAYERGMNKSLLRIYEKVRQKGYTTEDMAKFMGMSNSKVVRCMKYYGGLPEEYIDLFAMFLKKIGISVNSTSIQKCVVVTS